MGLKIAVKPNLIPKLSFTPYFNLSLQILQYNHQALNEYVLAQANENPLLEIEMSEEYYLPPISSGSQVELYQESSSLTDYLWEQARLLKTDQPALLEYCINLIDERGYFNEDPKKVAHEQRTSEQSVLKCLALIQSLEPLGVGARYLSECLLIQVQERYPNQPLLKLLITEYLYLIAEGDFELIAKETQSSLAEIKTNVALIKSLNPN